MAQPEIIKDIDARVKDTGDTMTGNLTAPKFIGSLQGNADTATTAERAKTVPYALTSNGTKSTTTAGYTYGVAGVTSGNRIFAKWYVNLNTGNKTLADGMLIEIKIPVAGCSSGDCITIDGTNFHPVVFNTNSIITTHYGVNTKLLLMYDSSTSANVYGSSTGATATAAAAISGVWRVMNNYDANSNTVPSAYCTTAAATAAKTATCTDYVLLAKSYLHVIIKTANTAASALTFNVNGKGAKPIYINGSASSSSNHTLPAGSYLVYYDGTNYYFRTDGSMTGSITGNAATATKLATAHTIDGVSFNGSAAITHYGTCSTTAATVEKVVSVTGFTLVTGAEVTVKFTVTNTASSPTLNVNGTGAKAIYYKGAAISKSYLVANKAYKFVYDGTNYVLIGDVDTNTTYYTGHVNCTTAAATAAKIGSTSYYTLANNRYFMLMMRYANTAASALTLNINSSGAKPIYINGSASSANNYTLPAGMYLVYYNGTNYYFRTDGSIQGGYFIGNASTSSKLANARTISLTGDVTGSGSFDGSANLSITATVADDSHNHIISNIDGLQTALDEKMNKAVGLSGKNLNEITTPGFYFGAGSNGCTNKPSNADAFGLEVFKTAGGYITQILTEGNINAGCRYIRQNNGSSWSSWVSLPIFSTTPASGQIIIADGTNGKIKTSGYTIATSVPNNAVFTDTKVTQTVTTSNTTYPLLLAPNGQTTTTTTSAYFDSGVTLNPSTNTIVANISGNAATATKLTTSAGSATQPVYFSEGKPVAITGTIANSTSGNAATATKLATARTISLTGSVTGSGSFDGSGNLSIATTTNHNHDSLYPKKDGTGASGTWSINISKNAATATKLQTARNIILNGNLQGSASFDGTGDATITALNYQSSIGGGNTYNYPWHRIATTTIGTSLYTDKSALLRIRHTFNGGGEGLVKVSARTNSTGSGCDISAIWLYRYNIATDSIGIGLWGVTGDNVYVDVYYKCAYGWPRAIVESISNGRIFTLISSNEASDTTTTDKKTSSEVYTSIENGATLIRGQAYTKIVYGSDGTDNGRYVLKTGDTMTGNLTAPKFIGALQGNADSATKLKTARTLTIGKKEKTFDGSANVSWSLSEIGADPAGTAQSYYKKIIGDGRTAGNCVCRLQAYGTVDAGKTEQLRIDNSLSYGTIGEWLLFISPVSRLNGLSLLDTEKRLSQIRENAPTGILHLAAMMSGLCIFMYCSNAALRNNVFFAANYDDGNGNYITDLIIRNGSAESFHYEIVGIYNS